MTDCIVISPDDFDKIVAHSWLHVGIGAGVALEEGCYGHAVKKYRQFVCANAHKLIDFESDVAKRSYKCAVQVGRVAKAISGEGIVKAEAFEMACGILETQAAAAGVKGMFCSGTLLAETEETC
jgi:hypothetical protein